MDVYLTTKEVAELLRVKERKVYDLAGAGEIPHRRITGKLLFPRAELAAWLDGAAAASRPAVLTGSHDPLLEWAVMESGASLALLFNGSHAGLTTFAAGEASLTGLHIREASGWNTATAAAASVPETVLVGFATRSRGLILAPRLEGAITSLHDCRAHKMVLRQEGAGTATLLAHLMAPGHPDDLTLAPVRARTESDAAAAVAAGEGDVTLGIAAMARRFRLPFVPLLDEPFDLLIHRRAYFESPVQTLMAFTRTPAFAQKADALGGYDLHPLGTVRWLSP